MIGIAIKWIIAISFSLIFVGILFAVLVPDKIAKINKIYSIVEVVLALILLFAIIADIIVSH